MNITGSTSVIKTTDQKSMLKPTVDGQLSTLQKLPNLDTQAKSNKDDIDEAISDKSSNDQQLKADSGSNGSKSIQDMSQRKPKVGLKRTLSFQDENEDGNDKSSSPKDEQHFISDSSK